MDEIDDKQKLFDILRGFDTLMLGTAQHARPMAVADIDPAGVVWFVTAEESPKVDEMRTDPRAVVTGQSSRVFVSVSGHVDVVRDRDRIRALWKAAWKAWFPKGPDDPTLVLVRFDPLVGEYWDQSGTRGLRYVFDAAREMMNGERPAEGRDQHAKVPIR